MSFHFTVLNYSKPKAKQGEKKLYIKVTVWMLIMSLFGKEGE